MFQYTEMPVGYLLDRVRLGSLADYKGSCAGKSPQMRVVQNRYLIPPLGVLYNRSGTGTLIARCQRPRPESEEVRNEQFESPLKTSAKTTKS